MPWGRNVKTHDAFGAVRCKDCGGTQVLLGGALEIIGGALVPPKRYKVPPLVTLETVISLSYVFL